MSRSGSRPRGFTLIEVMVVTAIIGILASVAFPELTRLLYRARGAERREVLYAIKRGVEDLYVQNGALPKDELLGECQPSCSPPTAARRNPDWAAGDWKLILRGSSGGPDIEGALFYSYAFKATKVAGGRDTLDLWAIGDLDGDGSLATFWARWERVDGVFRTYENAAWQSPIGWVERGIEDVNF